MDVLRLAEKFEPKDWVVVGSALLAAVTSTTSLVVGAYGALRAESRKSQREMLVPVATRIGELLHQLLAASEVSLGRRAKGQTVDTWLKRASDAAKDLKKVRRIAKYPLWGADHALNELGRLPSWLRQYNDNPAKARELLDAAEAVRLSVDRAVLASLRTGRPPGTFRRTVIRYQVWRMRRVFAGTAPQDEDDED
jgi:hypothetical protein